MIDRSYIGHKREALTVVVEPFQLRLFAKAIGETNPIYLEEEAAKAAGYRNMLAPPTFANDLPGGSGRYVQKSEGFVNTLVNGQVFMEGSEETGARAGVVLRSA